MKFEDMYVGQKVRVRSWEDMVSDPDLKLLDDGRVIISTSPDEFAMFLSDNKPECGTIVTVRSLWNNSIGNDRTGYIVTDADDRLVSRAWASWMFEPVDIEAKIESGVFLSCLLL